MKHAARPAYDDSREFEFGLELILDGLEREVKDVGLAWSRGAGIGGGQTAVVCGLSIRPRSGRPASRLASAAT